MNQSRLGGDPLERTLIRDTSRGKPDARPKPPGPAAGKASLSGAEKKILDAMKEGRGKNYYLRGRDQDKELLQKVLIYLPFELVNRLKKEAIDERISMSALIQKRLCS